MKKNDLIKTDNGIYRILSLNGDRILVIDCAKKTMPKFFPVSSLGNIELLDHLPSVFPGMDDLSPADRKVAQERYTMIAGAVSVVDDPPQRNLMIEKAAKQSGLSKQSIRSFLCSYLVYQDMAALAPKQVKENALQSALVEYAIMVPLGGLSNGANPVDSPLPVVNGLSLQASNMQITVLHLYTEIPFRKESKQ